jgi:pyrimidine operon attenuation protein/uracil phosphoribosyltransferase
MKNKTSKASSIMLMGSARVQRSINRIAYQITEDNREQANILVAGIKKRGYVIAKLLAERLTLLSTKTVKLLQLPADEEEWRNLKSLNEEFPYVVLTDDVIFSGRTMLDALKKVQEKVDANKLRVAVLVDRGHRSVPVEAGFVGLQLPTKLNEHVQVETGSNSVKKVVLNNSSV